MYKVKKVYSRGLSSRAPCTARACETRGLVKPLLLWICAQMTETLTSILCQMREVRLSSKELGTVVILGLTDSCVSTYCSWTKYHKVDNGLSKSPAKWTEDNTRNISTNSWQRATPLLSQHEPFNTCMHRMEARRLTVSVSSCPAQLTGMMETLRRRAGKQITEHLQCSWCNWSTFHLSSLIQSNGYCADSTSLRENTLRLESKCFPYELWPPA